VNFAILGMGLEQQSNVFGDEIQAGGDAGKAGEFLNKWILGKFTADKHSWN